MFGPFVASSGRWSSRARTDRSLIARFLLTDTVPLQLDVHTSLPEGSDQRLKCPAPFVQTAACECSRKRSFIPSGQTDQTFCSLLNHAVREQCLRL